jgi:hypothetical protein
VQYRYGVPGKIELLYPQSKVPPKGRFYVVNASEGSVSLNIIKFYNEGIHILFRRHIEVF